MPKGNSKKTLYLVDGTALCYRSFFALPLSNSKGVGTGAVFGVYQTLKKICAQYNPWYMGVCFDVSRKTFRQKKYKEYKITRPPVPDGLPPQIALIKKLIAFLGIPLVEKEGFEADDLIATLTRQARQKGWPVMIVTSDKDMYQLLEKEEVKIYNPAKDTVMGEQGFVKDFGFAPVQIVDYLSLVGDSADNVPGARGIGKVGAAKLIKEFGTVENIFDSLEKISGSTQKKLVESKEDIFLSKELIHLYSCELGLTLDDLRVKEAQRDCVYKLFYDLEFRKLLKDFAPVSCEVSLPVKKREALVSEDFSGGIVFQLGEQEAFVLAPDKKSVYEVALGVITPLLEDCQIPHITYNLKEAMLRAGVLKVEGVIFDVALAAYVLDPAFAQYSLEALVSHYLDDFVSDVGCAESPHFIDRLYQHFKRELKKQKLEELFYDVEVPLIAVLRDMQEQGVAIDLKQMKTLLKEVDKRLQEVSRGIFKQAGKEFNLNSPKQLSVVLFEDLKIPPIKKTKTGYSTGEEVLAKLRDKHPIAADLLEYRELNKLRTTYILPLMEGVVAGRLHAHFNQTATQTGRLSSSSPNLQSIPHRGRFSVPLRKAFISSFQGGVLVSGDYSQIELRILAHFSGDDRLREAFLNKRDIHTFTASQLFGTSEEQVQDWQRDVAKRVNFGIIYGMSAYGLSRELNISPFEAETFIQDYFARYPQVRTYIQTIYKEVEEKGYVSTLLGRRRYLPDFKSGQPQVQEFARRQAVNTPIQGSSADLIKVAMISIAQELKTKNMKTRLTMQIHDELVCDVPASESAAVPGLVKKHMEKAVALSVPVEVKVQVGTNWGEMKEWRG